MIAWLRIEGDPVRLYYSDTAALPLLDAQTSKHDTLLSIGTIRETTEGETANLSVVIDIASRAHFDDPPIGARAIAQSDEGDQFAGTIQTVSVELGGITIGIQQ